MAEQEQELYGDELGMGGSFDDGQEVPVENGGGDEQMGQQNQEPEELEKMKKRLRELEEEAARLRPSQQTPQVGSVASACLPPLESPLDTALVTSHTCPVLHPPYPPKCCKSMWKLYV
eukprot:941310-Pelagomonas_calceolata.AAC.2